MPARAALMQPVVDWWSALSTTMLAFLMLCCPIILTCVPAELERAARQQQKRIMQCHVAQEQGQAIVILSSYADASGAGSVACSIATCELTSETSKPQLLSEHRRLNCTAWIEQRCLLLAADDSHLFAVQPGRVRPQVGRFSPSPCATQMRINPHSKHIVVKEDDCLTVYQYDDLDRLADAQLLWRSDDDVEAFELLTEGKRLVVARFENATHRLVLVDLASGIELGTLAWSQHGFDKLYQLPGSRHLLAVGGSNVHHVSLESAGIKKLGTTPARITTGLSGLLAVAPKREVLLTTNFDGSQLIAWNLQSQSPLKTFPKAQSMLIGAEFLDDNRFVTWGMDEKLRIWNYDSMTIEREVTF